MLELKGKLEKVTWQDVQKDVAAVNPEFAKIIDSLSPGKKHWLVKATYPYGAEVLRRSILMLPNDNGTLVPITDNSLDPSIIESINYNMNSNPVSFVLKNTFEVYLPLDDRTIPLNGLIHPGVAFGASRVLLPKKSRQAVFIWDMSSGARTVTMMPKITELKRHKLLEREFDLLPPAPRSTIQHWNIFRHIANHKSIDNKWNAEILFFPKQWFEHLDDISWQEFYQYFHNFIWGGNELANNHVIYDLVSSLILKDYEIRPSAYTLDIVKYLLYIAVGAFAGLAPATNNLGGPFELIQDAYENIYGLKKYAATIIQPQLFDPDNPRSKPAYYSLSHPVAFEFKQSSRSRTNHMTDLIEVMSVLNRFMRELSTDKFNISQSALGDVCEKVVLEYFHNHTVPHPGIRSSAEMLNEDPRFTTTIKGKKFSENPGKCSFIQALIRVSQKP